MRKSGKNSVIAVLRYIIFMMAAFLAAMVVIAAMQSCASNPVTPGAPSVPVEIPAPVVSKDCVNYAWKDRGKAPIGYYKGMIRSWQVAQCTATAASSPISDKVYSRKADGSVKYYVDALKNYNLGAGEELLKTYNFLIGLAQRESSGNASDGLDLDSDQPWEASSTEAGAYQISWDGMNAHPEMMQVYKYYQAHPELCFKDIYLEGVKIRTGGYIGSGPGRDFQNFVRSCPGVQAPLAALYTRFLSPHFGPINTKKVEYNLSCEKMLRDNKVSCQ